MKLSIKSGSENYTCTPVLIKEIYPIEGADRIQRTVIFGNNVVIGKDVKIGDVMLYFNSGTKLNPDYCKANNLYTDTELNADKTASKGYVGKQGRVKAIKLRGVISDGILMPVVSLKSIVDFNSLEVGVEFTDINNVSICEKYIVPVRNSGTGKTKKQPTKVSRLVENQFYLHNDTDNLRRNAHKIKPDDIIGIHYKKHGTSIVIGNVLVKKNLSLYQKFLRLCGADVKDTEYDILYSSRKVIKNGYLNTNPNSFYKTDIWGDVKETVKDKIPKNWTLYGEILGFTKDGSPIQSSKGLPFDYGCERGTHKFYVYRITIVNPDGLVAELNDNQIAEFCERNGLNYKDTFFYYGKAKDLFPDLEVSEHWNENFIKRLEEKYTEKDCYMCTNKLPEEGIVVRVESLFEYEAYKLKSHAFLLRESEEQENEIVNIEDYQEVVEKI